jgi:hypothetical protein
MVVIVNLQMIVLLILALVANVYHLALLQY